MDIQRKNDGMRHLISTCLLLMATHANASVVEFACQESLGVPASKKWVTVLFDTQKLDAKYGFWDWAPAIVWDDGYLSWVHHKDELVLLATFSRRDSKIVTSGHGNVMFENNYLPGEVPLNCVQQF